MTYLKAKSKDDDLKERYLHHCTLAQHKQVCKQQGQEEEEEEDCRQQEQACTQLVREQVGKQLEEGLVCTPVGQGQACIQ